MTTYAVTQKTYYQMIFNRDLTMRNIEDIFCDLEDEFQDYNLMRIWVNRESAKDLCIRFSSGEYKLKPVYKHHSITEDSQGISVRIYAVNDYDNNFIMYLIAIRYLHS